VEEDLEQFRQCPRTQYCHEEYRPGEAQPEATSPVAQHREQNPRGRPGQQQQLR
jgi:hypothetical protein